jgi:glutamyl endopeptidase
MSPMPRAPERQVSRGSPGQPPPPLVVPGGRTPAGVLPPRPALSSSVAARDGNPHRRVSSAATLALPRPGGERSFRGEVEPDLLATPPGAAPAGGPVASTSATPAWLGSDPTWLSSLEAMVRPDLNALVAQTTFANDNRRQLLETRLPPWCWICSLLITPAAFDAPLVGSGWLAGPRTVITAGHCVYLHKMGGWARRVQVCPGRNGADKPWEHTATDLHCVAGWTERQLAEYDYGAVFLSEPVKVPCNFACRVVDDNELRTPDIANVVGYPADKPPGTLWGCSRLIREVQPCQLVYAASTVGGLSGCPVCYKQGETRIVIGIHNDGDLAGSTATRITPAVSSNVQRWISA